MFCSKQQHTKKTQTYSHNSLLLFLKCLLSSLYVTPLHSLCLNCMVCGFLIKTEHMAREIKPLVCISIKLWPLC